MGLDTKPFGGLWQDEVCGHSVECLVGHVAPIDAGRLLLIAPMNVGEALRVGGVDHVQDVIRLGRLEDAAHPPPALGGVPEEVEDDRHALAEQLAGKAFDQPPTLGRRDREILKRFDLEAERADPLVLTEHDRRKGSAELAGQCGFSSPCLAADEVKRGLVADDDSTRHMVVIG